MAMIGQRRLPLQLESGVPDASGTGVAPLNLPANFYAPKPSFFGQGGAGRAIAGTIGDYLLQLSHMQPIYAPARAEQTAFERGEQQYRTHRQDSNDDWMMRQQYEDAHKGPTGFGAELAAAGIMPGTPEYAQKMSERVANQLDPFVTVPMPSGTYSGPRSGFVQQFGNQPRPVGKLTQINGGQTPPASGNFRPR